MMRKIIIVLLLGLIFWPSTIFAIGDQRCWKRAECEAARVRIIGEGSEAKDGFVSTKEDSSVAAACPNQVLATDTSGDSDVGFCLPVGQSVTRISFGGTNKFLNIGEFIKFIYRYSMWAATIIAVMLVIVSGIQWTASGGNADMIGSAKKRIAGAISGLILLAFAYTILNTINPFLVNLRLPQAWLINEIGLVPPFCSQIKNDKIRLAYYKKSDEIIDDKATTLKYNEAQSKGYNIPSTVDKQPDSIDEKAYPKCGHDYLVQGSSGLSCQGSLCGSGNTCSQVSFGKNKKGEKDIISNPSCQLGSLIIRLKLDDFFQTLGAKADSFWVDTFGWHMTTRPKWLDHGKGTLNDMSLYFICPNVEGVVFPKNFYGWDKTDWLLDTNVMIPNDNNSLKGQLFEQNFFNFSPGHTNWQEVEDSNDNTICLGKGTPSGVWVRLEVNDAALGNTDAYLFIGQTADGKAVVGSWNDVAKHAIRMDEIEKTGVFLDGTVTENVIETIFDDKYKHQLPPEYKKPQTLEEEQAARVKQGTCFPAGTKIVTLTGEKNIEDVNKYDPVLSYDINDNTYHIGQVGNIVTHTSNGYYVINDGTLSVTGGHPIYVKKDNGYIGWAAIKPEEVPESSKVNALQLKTGDYFFTKDNSWIKIKKINFIAQQIKVYNLKAVSSYNTFFANDILVHNKQ